MISFRGPIGSQLILSDSWSTVTQEGKFPFTVGKIEPLKLKVLSFNDSEIVVEDTNRVTQIDIGIRMQITIFDTKSGNWWTSPDPQIINEKKSGGG